MDENRDQVAVNQDLDYFPLSAMRRPWMDTVKGVYREYMAQLCYSNLRDFQRELAGLA